MWPVSSDPAAKAAHRARERAECRRKGECYHPLVSLVCNQCCRCNTSAARGEELARLHSLHLASSNFYVSPNGTIMGPHSHSDETTREIPWDVACDAVHRMPYTRNNRTLLKMVSEGVAASEAVTALSAVATAVCADVAARGVLCNASAPCHCTVTPSGALRICTHRRGQRRWRGLVCEPLASGLYMRIGGAASRYLRCATFSLTELSALWRSLRECASETLHVHSTSSATPTTRPLHIPSLPAASLLIRPSGATRAQAPNRRSSRRTTRTTRRFSRRSPWPT
jgi:hypothetical protein